MGINGLLKLIEAARSRKHISAYAGHRVAVDAYCWLHKAVYSCSTELALGVPTDRWLSYCLKKVDILRHNNVTPVMVFDGGHLPLKRSVEVERRRRREDARKRGLELYRQENFRDAEAEFVKAVDITTDMAVRLIRQLQAGGVECIIAPYEADAQLAYLAITGYVHAVITEDSDLLAFGAPRVMFKMEKTGDGDEITRDALWSLSSPSFANWTPAMFRHMCILMGCDYTPSITGLGPKKAFGLVSKFKDIERILAAVKLDTKSFTVPPDYDERFRQADLTFQHQRIYDPVAKRMATLTPLPDALLSALLDFLGPPLPPEVCHQIATAQLDPYTKQPYPEPAPPPAVSQSDATMKRTSSLPTFGQRKRPKPEPKAAPFPVQRNVLTKYFAPVTALANRGFKPPRPINNGASDSDSPPALSAATPSGSATSVLGESDDAEPQPTGSLPLNGSVETVPASPPTSDSGGESESSDVEIVEALSDPAPQRQTPPVVPATPPTKVLVSKYFTASAASPTGPPPAARNLARELLLADERAPNSAPSKAFVSPNVTQSRVSLAGRRPAAPGGARSFLSPYFSPAAAKHT